MPKPTPAWRYCGAAVRAVDTRMGYGTTAEELDHVVASVHEFAWRYEPAEERAESGRPLSGTRFPGPGRAVPTSAVRAVPPVSSAPEYRSKPIWVFSSGTPADGY